jgi:Cys-tRNA(Pro) deacylase
MEDDKKNPVVVLMHGDLEVSTKNLARLLDVKSVRPCAPDVAHKHSGYMVGGTSPFGTRKIMPVYMEETVLILPKIYVNGGKRGYLVGIDPRGWCECLSQRWLEWEYRKIYSFFTTDGYTQSSFEF